MWRGLAPGLVGLWFKFMFVLVRLGRSWERKGRVIRGSREKIVEGGQGGLECWWLGITRQVASVTLRVGVEVIAIHDVPFEVV